ncbi:hypothetical protein ABGF48_05265 [Helcococcus bovis]
MTKEERLAYVEWKMNQPLPIYDDEGEEIKNIKGQVNMKEL